MFHDGGIDEAQRVAFQAALGKALADSRRRHILSRDDFQDFISEHPAEVPLCFKGLEPCISPQTLLFDELGLTALVKVDVAATDEGFRARYRLVDRRGSVTKKSTVTGASTRKTAFSLVRDLFDATGRVTIRSTPEGAAVRIDGETVGTTPLESRLPIGKHTYSIQHPGFRPREGSFELTSGADETLETTLERRPGELLVENAPGEAKIFVNGEDIGAPGEAVELQPGSYEVKVAAKGYEPYEETIDLESGERIERSIPLERKNPLLQDVSVQEISLNHYVARLTYDHSIHPTSFRDARARIDGDEIEFQGFADDDGALPAGEVVRRTVDPNGLRFDLSYTGRNFGVVALSLSYTATRADRRAYIDLSPTDDDNVLGTVTGLRRLQLRPLQVSYRHFFGNFVPSIEVGTGLSFQWVTVEGIPDQGSVTLKQTEPFWTLGLSGQYFFDENWFGLIRYGVQDYFNAGKGVEHVLSIGAGAAFPNIFGFEPEPPEEL